MRSRCRIKVSGMCTSCTKRKSRWGPDIPSRKALVSRYVFQKNYCRVRDFLRTTRRCFPLGRDVGHKGARRLQASQKKESRVFVIVNSSEKCTI